MKIEEITDQVAKSMDLSDSTETASAPPPPPPPQEAVSSQTPDDASKDTTTPDLPPALASAKGKSVDEVFAELNKSPLFMTELEENDDTAALQALNYDGAPSENGASFKERGNECFKNRGYGDAKEFYTRGIEILALEEAKRARGEVTLGEDGQPASDDEVAAQREVLETLYVNRAAVHLALKNYRSCWLDCAGAIRLNPRNLKAYYRSAKALLAVDRIDEADDVCSRGLTLDGENLPLLSVAAEIIARAKWLDEKKAKEDERAAQRKRREMLVKAALKARGIPTRTTDKPPEMEDAKMELVPDPDDPRSALSFPAVFLYPVHLQSDFIKSFNETHTLEDHLSYMLPLPWDEEGAYKDAAAVECYLETRDGGVLKMGKRVTLLKALSTGKVEVVDEVVKIFVLPKDKAEGWIKTFKEQKAAAMRKR